MHPRVGRLMPRTHTTIASPAGSFRQQKRALIREHAGTRDQEGFWQVATTLLPLAVVCAVAVWSLQVSLWISAAATLAISILMVRVFGLLHECGHGSLFRTQRLNRAFGFAFGVLSGMPQYVWSQHHHFHHQTNGNWDLYRGARGTLTTDEYDALTRLQQRVYRTTRHVVLAPIAGFVYLILNPRLNWVLGSSRLLIHVVRRKFAEPGLSIRAHAATFRTRLWKSAKEHRHQSANNLVLLSLWLASCLAIGAGPFFAIYLTSVSLAGGVAIALFTVQHNFEDSYAATDAEWDLDTGALEGTSYLVLPRWLNWTTVNIGFHHVHHLSASIPGSRLPRCHEQFRHLFTGVTRISLSQIPRHLSCILWDRRTQRITSVRAHLLLKEARLAGVLSPPRPVP